MISHKLKKAIHKTFSVMFLCNTGGRHGFHDLLMLPTFNLKKLYIPVQFTYLVTYITHIED